jgi:hypothetical protein
MYIPDIGTLPLLFKGKVAPATFAIGRDGEGLGLQDTEGIRPFAPIPVPTSPLKVEEFPRQQCPLLGIQGFFSGNHLNRPSTEGALL